MYRRDCKKCGERTYSASGEEKEWICQNCGEILKRENQVVAGCEKKRK